MMPRVLGSVTNNWFWIDKSLVHAPFSSLYSSVLLWPCTLKWTLSQSQSHNATDGQPVSKSWCRAPSGAHDQIFVTVCHLVLIFVGRPLCREDGSVFCICCWPLPAQSFSGPSPLLLATIFYCLRFETSIGENFCSVTLRTSRSLPTNFHWAWILIERIISWKLVGKWQSIWKKHFILQIYVVDSRLNAWHYWAGGYIHSSMQPDWNLPQYRGSHHKISFWVQENFPEDQFQNHVTFKYILSLCKPLLDLYSFQCCRTWIFIFV
jgi:hypothetical protein